MKVNYQSDEKPDKTVSKNYFRKLLSAHLFTTSLPSLSNFEQFLGYTAILNYSKDSNM